MILFFLLPVVGLACGVAAIARPAYRDLVGRKTAASMLLSVVLVQPVFWIAVIILFARRRGADRPRVVALALALACGGYGVTLAVRCFGIEVFRITSGSMMPTLEGGSYNDLAGGDRVVVDKTAYLRGPVRRWDLVVFRYPLDKSRSFAKRVIGLPGEEVLVRRGDVCTRVGGTGPFTLARKPHDVQESIWMPVAPAHGLTEWESEPPERARRTKGGVELDCSASRGSAICRYPAEITDRLEGVPVGGTNKVIDLRLRARLGWDGRAYVTLRIVGERGTAELAFASGGGGSVAWTSPSTEVSQKVDSPNLALDAKPCEVRLATYDGVVEASIDDREPVEVLARTEFEPHAPARASNVEFEVSGGKVTFADVVLERDLYHIDGGPSSVLHPEGTIVRVPEHSLFVLGDNSANAKDGRLWRRRVLRLRDGRAVRADASKVHLEDDAYSVRDEWGIEQRIARSDLAGPPETEACPFVDEDLLRGRLWVIWWPPGRARWFP